MRAMGRLLAGVAVLVLTACGGDGGGSTSSEEGGSEATSGASASEETGAEGCADVLDDDKVTALLGTEQVPEPEEAEVGDLPACTWADGDKQVQTVSASADDWAAALPDLLEQLRESGTLDPAAERKLSASQEKVESGDATGCDLFQTLVVDVQGLEPDATQYILYVPDVEDPQAASVQSCIGEEFFSVQLTDPALEPGKPVEDALVNAMAELRA